MTWWFSISSGLLATIGIMQTTPLRTERDEDLRQAIRAVDPEDPTTVFSAVPGMYQTAVLPPVPRETMVLPAVPAAGMNRTLVLAAVGAAAGLGLLALLVSLVVDASNSSTTIVRAPVAPVTKTATAQVITPPSPSASVPVSPAPADTPPPRAVTSAERMAPSPTPTPQQPIRDRLHDMFPRLFP